MSTKTQVLANSGESKLQSQSSLYYHILLSQLQLAETTGLLSPEP